MPNGPITLVDIAARNGEKVAALVEDVSITAPEWGVIPARTVSGTSYDVLRRVGLPHGRFRDVGEGVPMLKSAWERETKPMFYFDNQLRIGNDIVKAQSNGDQNKVPDILADEAAANVAGSAIYMGSQAWYGQALDIKGFIGINAMISDLAGGDVNAGGTPGSTSSAYLAFLDGNENNPEGLHFAVGLNGQMSFSDWAMMQHQVPGTGINGVNARYRTDWSAGFEFYCGLSVGSKDAVFRIRNIDLAHPLTDALAAQLIAGIPLQRRGKLRWFLNRTALFTLQQSRTGLAYNQGVGGNIAPVPTDLGGYPITVTDSLLNTETDGVAVLPDYSDVIR